MMSTIDVVVGLREMLPGTASGLADSHNDSSGTWYTHEGLPILLDPSSISSYSFHGAHLENTTSATKRR